MRKHVGGDPRWIITKYPGSDRKGVFIPKGTRVFYYPTSRAMLTGAEAEQASRDFEAARFDEATGG
ncbi:hypothetical protein MA20_42970 [Bradyrhizobium japonicum]|uniref:Uncharacterized protein n=1 Tax=Bradyrhizobium japonicum TaxID=375 RepID=A0A0A3YJ23_BRAJP|nr:hypothetical protein [Bradyrhizobium japonicum]KGT73713.1 hypothetical protein MA20_42970 [Bradyrhizobium japonicum]